MEEECLTGAEKNSWKAYINRLYLFKIKNYFYYRVKDRMLILILLMILKLMLTIRYATKNPEDHKNNN